MEKSQYETLGKCCPIFDPETLDNKIHHWQDQVFVKESIPTFFHIPIPGKIGKKIEKMVTASQVAGMMPKDKRDFLVLFHDPTAFRSDMYIPVNGEVTELDNVKLPGNYISKVYEGKYKDVPKVIRAMDAQMKKEGQTPDKYFIHYAYCPKCSKEAGTNYIVVFAEVNEN